MCINSFFCFCFFQFDDTIEWKDEEKTEKLSEGEIEGDGATNIV